MIPTTKLSIVVEYSKLIAKNNSFVEDSQIDEFLLYLYLMGKLAYTYLNSAIYTWLLYAGLVRNCKNSLVGPR